MMKVEEIIKRIESIDKSKYSDSLLPVFPDNKKAIVFESSGYFVPYLSVVLKSLIDKSMTSNVYDIIVLTSEIDSYDIDILINLAQAQHNISIRFFDPSIFVKKYMKENPNSYLEINYYRLALPWILAEYDQVLNLGADIIIERDVEELLSLKMNNNEYIAGAVDLGYLGRLKMDISVKELDLQNPYGYVNADVLVFNLKNIRRDFSIDEMMLPWKNYLLRCAEQDALNMLFDGHIKHISLQWNLYPKKMASVEHIAHNNLERIEQWEEAVKDPFIIHFAAYPKPWDYPMVGYGDKWWSVAKKSPYYAELLRRLSVVSVRSEFGYDRLLIQKIGDKLLPIFPRNSRFREFCKKIYSVFFKSPNKEWGKKFGKLRG